MNRRDVIMLLGGSAAVWPLGARAQQGTVPVVGYLDSRMPDSVTDRLRGLRQGLKDTGFVEGENLAIAYRFAQNQNDQLPELAADLVRRRVAAIVAASPLAAFAAKAATSTIPTVFLIGDDPVRLGLVASLARPEGNLTGINIFVVELAAKRLELLRELVPKAARIAVLVNRADPDTENQLRSVEAAALAIGLKIQVLNADASREIDAAFDVMGRERPDALFVTTTAFLNSRRVQLVQLAAFHRLPAAYGLHDFAEAGGLLSYGSNVMDAYRQAGVYVGRVLKGVVPADLPVMQASKFQLVINHQTARMLGLTVPPSLLALADEVID